MCPICYSNYANLLLNHFMVNLKKKWHSFFAIVHSNSSFAQIQVSVQIKTTISNMILSKDLFSCFFTVRLIDFVNPFSTKVSEAIYSQQKTDDYFNLRVCCEIVNKQIQIHQKEAPHFSVQYLMCVLLSLACMKSQNKNNPPPWVVN